jgi:hypothetical protein
MKAYQQYLNSLCKIYLVKVPLNVIIVRQDLINRPGLLKFFVL